MRWGVSPASVIGGLAIVVTLSGAAVATSSGGLTLGTTSRAMSTTTLHSRHGAALALSGRKGKPPLSVGGDKTLVPSLDASLLDGLSAAQVLGQVHVYAKAGHTTLHVPAGAHLALLTAVGGGGGGGGGGAHPGSAGGQGAYAQIYAPVTANEILHVDVAAGGDGGAAGAAGSATGGSDIGYGPGDIESEFYLAADGGNGGVPGTSCPGFNAGGSGGVAFGPTVADPPVNPADLTLVDGAAGGEGESFLSPTTHMCEGIPGAGAAAGFAGSGGNGGATTASGDPTRGTAGDSGLVTVEFFS